MLKKDEEWMGDSYTRAGIISEFEKHVGEKKRLLICTREAAVAVVLDNLEKNIAKDPKKLAVKEIVERWLKSSRCPKE